MTGHGEQEHLMSGLKLGEKVRVAEGVTLPDLPEILIAGWTGEIIKVTGRKPNQKFFVEWDQQTVGQFPEQFLARCEEEQLLPEIACLTASDLEPLE